MTSILIAKAFTSLPIALGVSILRYRLYEIDGLVSRALSYAVLTALLVGLYVVAVTLAYTSRLRSELTPEDVAADLLAVVGRTVEPRSAAVWLPPRVPPRPGRRGSTERRDPTCPPSRESRRHSHRARRRPG